MRFLHSADWHLGAPLGAYGQLRQELEKIPFRVVQVAREQQCDALLLAGDLFDGECTEGLVRTVKNALEEAAMPVFITPGNHDPVGADSPWLTESWPQNVHIFTGRQIESVALPQWNCRIYGAAFHGPESAALLEGFCADAGERYCIGLFHGDPTVAGSVYNPVSRAQIADSALDYLALGHIHKMGTLQSGGTLCGWPGCPMGRGYDETGEKGVLLVELEEQCQVRFLPLDTPRFFEIEAPVRTNPEEAVSAALSAAESQDHYRVILTGEAEPFSVRTLLEKFPNYPNLQLRDCTTPPIDLWENAGEDSLEGVYFGMLRQAMEGQDADSCRRIRLAAKISRQLLLGQEVKLP